MKMRRRRPDQDNTLLVQRQDIMNRGTYKIRIGDMNNRDSKWKQKVKWDIRQRYGLLILGDDVLLDDYYKAKTDEERNQVVQQIQAKSEDGWQEEDEDDPRKYIKVKAEKKRNKNIQP